MNVYDVFPTRIYKAKVDPSSYDKSSIIRTCMEQYEKSKYKNTWDEDSDLHHYYENWDGAPELGSLDQSYQKIIEECMNSISGKFEWRWNIVNLAVNTKYMAPHDHFYRKDGWQGMYSFVHYISYDKDNHTATRFINPLIFAQFPDNINDIGDLLDSEDDSNSTYYKDGQIYVEEDDVVIFPSYLKHFVRGIKEEGDKPRILGVANIDWKVK
jgi:hypothetical protein